MVFFSFVQLFFMCAFYFVLLKYWLLHFTFYLIGSLSIFAHRSKSFICFFLYVRFIYILWKLYVLCECECVWFQFCTHSFFVGVVLIDRLNAGDFKVRERKKFSQKNNNLHSINLYFQTFNFFPVFCFGFFFFTFFFSILW